MKEKKKRVKKSSRKNALDLLTMYDDILETTMRGNIEVYRMLLKATPKTDKSTKKMLEMSLRINENTLKLML